MVTFSAQVTHLPAFSTSGRGWWNSRALRGMNSSPSLIESWHPVAASEGLSVPVPDVALYTDPRMEDPAGDVVWSEQVDAVIQVDPDTYLCIGWKIQTTPAGDTSGTAFLRNIVHWDHLMWAVSTDLGVGPAQSLGAITDENWSDNHRAPSLYQVTTEYSAVFPAHYGVPAPGRRVRLPGGSADSDTVVAVGTDLALSFEQGPTPGIDVGDALQAEPCVQNGYLTWFDGSQIVQMDAAGARSTLDSPGGTVLTQPVDLGTGVSYAWLESQGGLPVLCSWSRGGSLAQVPLQLTSFDLGDDVRYELARFPLNPCRGQVAIARRVHPAENGRHWHTDVVIVSLVTGKVVVDWTRTRTRDDGATSSS